MLHKKQAIPSGLNFSNFPETFIADAPLTVNISASGTGATVGSTGLRWWDSSILTANGIIVLAANQSFTLPFSKNFLNPGYLMDLIVKVSLNGDSYWYAASNSLDNTVSSTPSTDKKLFYLELFCLGFNGAIGNPNTNNHFMQGGTPAEAETAVPVNVYLSEPTTTSGSFSVSATYVSYDSTTPPNLIFTKTISYGANQNAVTLFTLREMLYYFFNNSNSNYITYQHRGYYKIQVTCSDSSYVSMLNYYHYGQS